MIRVEYLDDNNQYQTVDVDLDIYDFEALDEWFIENLTYVPKSVSAQPVE